MMKVAIVGTRAENMNHPTDYDKRIRAAVFAYVSRLPKDTVLVSGGASGVDTWAVNAAKHYGLPKPIVHLPNWKEYGKSAGMIRNEWIVNDADYVVAFWNGTSKGTKNTIDRAQRMGKRVIINPQAA